MQRARLRVVLLTLAKHAGLAPLLFGPPLVWAYFEGARDFAATLVVPVGGGLLVVLATWRASLPDDLRGIEAMASLALIFCLAALGAVPAFMGLGMPFFAAFFESMSAITTTGLSVARDPDNWPFAAHMLRAWMQWCGGLAMATAVLALVLSPGLASNKMGRASFDTTDRIRSTRLQARELLVVYTGLTFVCAIPITLAIGNVGEGIAVTLAAVSTGGFAPRTDSLASYSALAQVLVIIACLLGAISLLTFRLVARGKIAQAWELGSVRRVLLAVVGLSGLYTALHVASGAALSDLFDALLNLASGLTTAGFSTSAMPTTPVLLLIFLAAMLLGADVGSTGGGLKLARASSLFRAARHSLRVARLPDRAVAPLRENGSVVDDRKLIGLLGLLAIYLMTAMIVWGMLLYLGHPPMPALFDAVSALSTVGLSTGIVGADLPPGALFVLTLAMWLGRLEFIAVLVLVLPRTWLRLR